MTTSSINIIKSKAVQPDVKILVYGEVALPSENVAFGLVRYNPGGSLNNPFSDDGKVITGFGLNSYVEVGKSIAVQAKGKIEVGGYIVMNSRANFPLIRYNADVALDDTFSGDGKLSIGL